MDLVQTIRKEGSRGGRADFKWEDVKNDTQRENYLGHSLMAPVGRWQQGRDLNWYARGDSESKAAEAARVADEKRKLKEAEEDAMLAAMGLPVPERGTSNANLTPLGKKAHEADVKDAIQEQAKVREDRATRREKKERSGRYRDDRIERERRHRSRSRSRDRHGDRRHRHRDRPRSRSRSRSRDHRRDHDRESRYRRHRSRSREPRRREHDSNRVRDRNSHKQPSRSRSRDRRQRHDSRSRSPYASHDTRRG